MANWRRILTSIAGNADETFSMLKYRLRERLGGRDPIMILPYRGYGTSRKLYLKGRVLEDKGIGAAADDDTIWDNLANMYKRFTSVEIPYARVRARFQGVEHEVVADEEGYFDVWIEPTHPLAEDRMWHQVELELVAPLRRGVPQVHAQGDVLVPPPGAQFAVISDIDDTVLHTDAVNLLRMARTVFLGNARTRLPFKGVAAFYRALFRGNHPSSINPMFYVSNSPWNLYDLLSEFFNLHEIPIGPVLFLRNWGVLNKEHRPTHKRTHKLRSARNMLDLFPHLPFILIGDSGEEDPEIYEELVRLYPERIQAVYIRNVSRDLKRPEEIKALAEKVLKAGSTLILADDTWPLAQHAAQQGWISPAELVDIEAERQKDAAPPTPLEQLLGEEEPPEAPTVVVADKKSTAAAPEEKVQEVKDGAIEEALKTAEDETKQAPTVIVEGDKHASDDREQ